MDTALDPARILRWYLDAGVDECVGETPVDRYAVFAAARAGHQAAVPSTPARTQPPPPVRAPLAQQQPAAAADGDGEGAVQSAHALATAADSVDGLRTALQTFDGCALKKTAMNLVFTDGNPQARIVFVGEAPGADEDRQGRPFVGASGRLLDRMLGSIGLDRTTALITNTVFWRPPGNRNPTTGEIAACLPFVERLIEIVDPEVMVALGGAAAKSMLAQTQAVSRLRGRWFPYATPGLSRPVQATALYHPAYLLRSPAAKREAWRDLLMIKDTLRERGVL